MRLLILVASLAYASGVLHGDITGDLKPPPPIAAAQQQQQPEISGYATTVGLGASASDAPSIAPEIAPASSAVGSAPSGVGWIGVADQQQQQQSLQTLENYRQEDQGLLASYQPSVQQVANIPQSPQPLPHPQIPQIAQVSIYKNSILGNSEVQHQVQPLSEPATLTSIPNYQQTTAAASQGSGTSNLSGHKYTTVTFGNGLVGLGHSVDYSSIKQSQDQGVQPQVQPQPQPEPQPQVQIPEQNNYIPEYSGSTGVSQSTSGYDTISYSQETPTIPIQVSQSYGVPNKPSADVSQSYRVPSNLGSISSIPFDKPLEVSHSYTVPQKPLSVELSQSYAVPNNLGSVPAISFDKPLEVSHSYGVPKKPLSVEISQSYGVPSNLGSIPSISFEKHLEVSHSYRVPNNPVSIPFSVEKPIEVSQSYGVPHKQVSIPTISIDKPIHVSQSYGVPDTPVSIPSISFEKHISQSYGVPQKTLSLPIIPTLDKHRPLSVEGPVSLPEIPSYPTTIEHSVSVPQSTYEYVKVEKPTSVKVPVADYPHHTSHLHLNTHQLNNQPHHNLHNLPSFNTYNYHSQLPLTTSSFHETSFHKEHYKPLTTYQPHQHYHQKDHFHHYHNDHYHHDATHHHGSNHHSSSILAGLSGGLSAKLRGGHGGGVSHHHGDGHGVAGNFGGDLKFANGLDAHLGHTYHKFGHGFAGSLGAHHGHGYASGYAGKYLSSGDYAKYTLPTTSSSYDSFGKEKFPVKYSSGSTFSSGKYSSFPGYHGTIHASATIGSSSFGSSSKIPETINQQYDSNGGYKY